MSLVYWDSMVFAYLLEKNPTFFAVAKATYEAMRRRGDTLCTSVITVGEILVGPRKLGSQSGSDRVSSFFASGTVRLLSYDLKTADHFATVRAWTGASSPDAIHLASAAQAQVDVFLTNDRKLRNLTIPGIRLFAGLEPQVLKSVFP
jgi:predicted nucleic acid-binding protein